jgi:glycosyltransferase involved in cell wall biosynthesis
VKILYIITRSDWGGAQAHLYDLIEGMIQRGYECEVIVGEKGEFFNRVIKLGIKLHHVDSLVHPISPVKDIKAIKECRKLIKDIGPNIIHCHSSKAGIVGRIAAKLERIPTIFTAHGWAFTDGVPLKKKLLGIFIEKIVSKITTKIICVSHFDKEIAIKYKIAPENKMIVIHNGVKDTLPVTVTKDPMMFTITMVARFASQKDQFTLIRALKEIDNVTVNFVGDGPLLGSAIKLAKENDVIEKCNFMGMRNDIDTILAKSHCFVLISNYEGLPISIIEAMRNRLPIVASDVGGVNEQVINNVNGFLVSNSIQEIVEKINYLKKNSDECIEFGDRSREIYEEKFLLDNMIDKVSSLYNSLK